MDAIAEAAPRVETVRGGTITPFRADPEGRRFAVAGCIYRADGTRVALSERFSGHQGDLVRNNNPETLPEPRAAAEPLPGRSLYLGHFMGGHYGHFITETLSTFWILQQEPAKAFDHVVFHPFLFGRAIPAYAAHCFAHFGIDPARIRFVGETPLAPEAIVVPERLFRLNHSADPLLAAVYRSLAEAAAPPPEPAPRLYLSRRRWGAQTTRRVLVNERAVERRFESRGFRVVFPETLTFPEQLGLYARAEALAGCSSSALHNSLFLPPGSLVVELGDPRYFGAPAPTQVLCDGIAGVRSHFVPFEGRAFRGTNFLFARLEPIEAALAALFGPQTVPAGPAARAALAAGVILDGARFGLRAGQRRLGRALAGLRARGRAAEPEKAPPGA